MSSTRIVPLNAGGQEPLSPASESRQPLKGNKAAAELYAVPDTSDDRSPHDKLMHGGRDRVEVGTIAPAAVEGAVQEGGAQPQQPESPSKGLKGRKAVAKLAEELGGSQDAMSVTFFGVAMLHAVILKGCRAPCLWVTGAIGLAISIIVALMSVAVSSALCNARLDHMQSKRESPQSKSES